MTINLKVSQDGQEIASWNRDNEGYLIESESSQEMTLKGYASLARRTLAPTDSFEKRLAVLALGLTGESGEVADIIKKVVGHGYDLELCKLNLMKEIGDVLWYLAVLSDVLELDFEDIASLNIDKLRARYPEEFSTERSVNR